MYSKRFSFKKNQIVRGARVGAFVVVSLAVFSLPSESFAVTLGDATTVRAGFSLPPVDDTSYDGPGFDAFKPYQSFTSSSFLEVGTFDGGTFGSNLDFFLLSEVAFYDGQVAGLGDAFGLLDSNGNFSSVIDPAQNPGFSTTVVQGSDEEFTLALQSPEGLFSSIDEDNPDDGAPHFIAQEVTQAGQVTIQNANLLGATLTFNLQVGDIILYIEDLLARGNMLNNGIPSDFDYNDMVVVLRSEPIPEPATCLLLGAGLSSMAIARRRRRMIS